VECLFDGLGAEPRIRRGDSARLRFSVSNLLFREKTGAPYEARLALTRRDGSVREIGTLKGRAQPPRRGAGTRVLQRFDHPGWTIAFRGDFEPGAWTAVVEVLDVNSGRTLTLRCPFTLLPEEPAVRPRPEPRPPERVLTPEEEIDRDPRWWRGQDPRAREYHFHVRRTHFFVEEAVETRAWTLLRAWRRAFETGDPAAQKRGWVELDRLGKEAIAAALNFLSLEIDLRVETDRRFGQAVFDFVGKRSRDHWGFEIETRVGSFDDEDAVWTAVVEAKIQILRKDKQFRLRREGDREPPKREREPGKPEKEPGKPEKEPGRPEKEPGKPEREPGKPEKEPGKPEKEPGKPEKEPARPEGPPEWKSDEPKFREWRLKVRGSAFDLDARLEGNVRDAIQKLRKAAAKGDSRTERQVLSELERHGREGILAVLNYLTLEVVWTTEDGRKLGSLMTEFVDRKAREHWGIEFEHKGGSLKSDEEIWLFLTEVKVKILWKERNFKLREPGKPEKEPGKPEKEPGKPEKEPGKPEKEPGKPEKEPAPPADPKDLPALKGQCNLTSPTRTVTVAPTFRPGESAKIEFVVANPLYVEGVGAPFETRLVFRQGDQVVHVLGTENGQALAPDPALKTHCLNKYEGARSFTIPKELPAGTYIASLAYSDLNSGRSVVMEKKFLLAPGEPEKPSKPDKPGKDKDGKGK
jgi:hypothetical protein